MKKHGLAPLVNKEPRILILGSLPSDESIRKQEYYGNPRNLFWNVIAGVFAEPVPETYEEKKALLFRHNIALWDVCASAEREGSLDTNIKNTEFNDLVGFIKKVSYPPDNSSQWWESESRIPTLYQVTQNRFLWAGGVLLHEYKFLEHQRRLASGKDYRTVE